MFSLSVSTKAATYVRKHTQPNARARADKLPGQNKHEYGQDYRLICRFVPIWKPDFDAMEVWSVEMEMYGSKVIKAYRAYVPLLQRVIAKRRWRSTATKVDERKLEQARAAVLVELDKYDRLLRLEAVDRASFVVDEVEMSTPELISSDEAELTDEESSSSGSEPWDASNSPLTGSDESGGSGSDSERMPVAQDLGSPSEGDLSSLSPSAPTTGLISEGEAEPRWLCRNVGVVVDLDDAAGPLPTSDGSLAKLETKKALGLPPRPYK